MANRKAAAVQQVSLDIIARVSYKCGSMVGCSRTIVKSVKLDHGHPIVRTYNIRGYADATFECDCRATTPYCKHIDCVKAAEMRRYDYVAPAIVTVVKYPEMKEEVMEEKTIVEAVPVEVTSEADKAEMARWAEQDAARAADYAQQQAAYEAAQAAPKTIEESLSPFMLRAMAGKNKTGTFSGRATKKAS